MKIDIDYISKLLNTIIESPAAHIDYHAWEKAGVQISSKENSNKFDEQFIFHIQLLLENRLLSNRELEAYSLNDLGISFNKSFDSIIDVPIRLTQNGHDFANALKNKEVLLKLKTELKDAPFKVVFEGSQKLLQHFFKKKIDSLIE